MRKVLHLRSSGGFLGAEKVVLELARNSQRYGFESIIGIPVDDDEIPELARRARMYDVRCELFPFTSPFSFSSARRIGDFVRDEQIDIVNTHGYREDIYAGLVLNRNRVVATNHLWKRTDLRLRVYAAVDAFVMRYFAAVIAVSQPILDEMKTLGIPAEKLQLIENGICVTDYSPDKPSRDEIRKQFSIGSDEFVFGMVGSLTKEKGHTYALQALSRILVQGASAKLVVIGDGIESDKLKADAHALGIANSVIFVGRRTDIPLVLQAFSVFVMPSLIEGLPMALLEAMASGLPVIATSVGDIPKLVEPGVGILIPPADVDALASAFSQMLSRRFSLQAMELQARTLVEQRFSAQHMAGQYVEIYRNITQKNGKDSA